jgi:hypothetical protein
MNACKTLECTRPAIAKGLCRSHYAQKAYRERVAADPEKMRASRERKKARRDNPRSAAVDTGGELRRRLRKFGLGLQDFARLLAEQQHACAICGGGNGLKHFAVDHCHATGRVRGLLCDGCNHGLGKFRDSVTLLRAAAAYLERPALCFKGPEPLRRGQKTGTRASHAALTYEQVQLIRNSPRGVKFPFCSPSIASRVRLRSIYKYIP